jgi:hypothetical protein
MHGSSPASRTEALRPIRSGTADGGHDRLNRRQIKAADEDSEPAEEAAILVPKEIVAPIDGLPKRMLPCWNSPRSSGQFQHAIQKASHENMRRQHSDPGGSQLNGER